jgi:hypothetical protein
VVLLPFVETAQRSTSVAKRGACCNLDEQLIEARSKRSKPMPFNQLEQREANRTFMSRIVATLPPRQQGIIQLKFQNESSVISQIRDDHAGQNPPKQTWGVLLAHSTEDRCDSLGRWCRSLYSVQIKNH